MLVGILGVATMIISVLCECWSSRTAAWWTSAERNVWEEFPCRSSAPVADVTMYGCSLARLYSITCMCPATQRLSPDCIYLIRVERVQIWPLVLKPGHWYLCRFCMPTSFFHTLIHTCWLSHACVVSVSNLPCCYRQWLIINTHVAGLAGVHCPAQPHTQTHSSNEKWKHSLLTYKHTHALLHAFVAIVVNNSVKCCHRQYRRSPRVKSLSGVV